MSPDPRLKPLITRWEVGRTIGPPPSVEELCADAPDLLPQLREAIRQRELAETPALHRPGDTDSGQASGHSPDNPPESVGGMTVIRQLGRGGMGWVLEVEDPKLRRRVAVKLMLPAVAANPAARERFLREARAQAAIEHEHVAPIFAVDDDSDPPYLVMPLLKGTTLAGRIATAGGPLPLSEAFRTLAQMAAGLAAAHARGLIHRDIKPGNVWLEGEKGKVRLLDFGLARWSGATGDVRLTQTGDLLGTPGYMAPEQAAGEEVDARADLFSLGCVAYEMFTGVRPFRGDSVLAIIAALATETPAPVRTLNPQVPRPLAHLIEGLLAKNPARRSPATAAGVVERLKQIAADASMPKGSVVPLTPAAVASKPAVPTAKPAAPPPPVAPRRVAVSPPSPLSPALPAKRRSRLPLFLLFTGIAVVGVGVVVVLTMLPRTPAETATSTTAEGPSTVLGWPFTPREAKAAQEAWAKRLGREVEEQIDLGKGGKLVVRLIPPGEYQMGSPVAELGRDKDDEAVRRVVIREPFYAGKFEVTQAQFRGVMDANPSYFKEVAGADRLPVDGVLWGDARKFCDKVRTATSGRWLFRLPTEEEWEWLARGGSAERYHSGNTLTKSVARFDTPTPWMAGSGTANAFGLYDVHGNVWEWCSRASGEEPRERVLRGGCWATDANACRSASRLKSSVGVSSNRHGFRVVAEPVKP